MCTHTRAQTRVRTVQRLIDPHRVTALYRGVYRTTNRQVIFGPSLMINVPLRHYVVIENPVMRTTDGELMLGKDGQVRLYNTPRTLTRTGAYSHMPLTTR